MLAASGVYAQNSITALNAATGVLQGAAGTHSAEIDGVFTGAGVVGTGVYGLQTGAMKVGGAAAFHR